MFGNDLPLYVTSPTFIILCLLSVYSLTVMLNQAYYFFSSREKVQELLQFLEDEGKSVKDLTAFAMAHNSPHRRLLRAALKYIARPAESLVALLGDEAKGLRWEAEHRLSGLGTIANIAPFIGLFGTVVGIIRAFHAIALKASAGPSVVASGISEALVSTAAGLIVAVPAVVAYNYFLKRSRRLGLELERVTTLILHRRFQ